MSNKEKDIADSRQPLMICQAENKTGDQMRRDVGSPPMARATQGSIPVYLGDDLHSRQPICRAVQAAGGHFLFVCKPSSHPTSRNT
jgi:hypothetical protein